MRYLHGPSNVGTRLLFIKFISETHSLNEELGRHHDREGTLNVHNVVESVLTCGSVPFIRKCSKSC